MDLKGMDHMHDRIVSGQTGPLKIPNYWPVVLLSLAPTAVIHLSIWPGNWLAVGANFHDQLLPLDPGRRTWERGQSMEQQDDISLPWTLLGV